MRTNNQTETTRRRRWTREENSLLLRHINAHPQNLHYCFTMVADLIDRTDKAVAAHWYQSLSKEPDVLCFFTASSQHVTKNRKNGNGVESSPSIWRRLVSIIRNII